MKMRLFMLLMVLCSTVSNVFAYDFQSGSLYYNITSDSTVAVTSGDTYYSELTSAVIPESVTYNGITYSVTSIGWRAFLNCSSLTSIVISNSVTTIGNTAFSGCSGLTSITIPNSVTSIGYYAFLNCTSLTSITIPNSVTSINGAFEGCSSLTSVTIPNSVTSIGSSAFEGCSSLTSIVIPNSVTSIGNRAFYLCSGLTSVTIPNGVTSIGYGTFYGCSSLTSIAIPNSVTSIGNRAFYLCSGLTSIVVGGGNTVYDSRDNCNAIVETASNTLVAGCQNTSIPNSVTSIGENAFSNCSGLTSVTIPNSVTSIGESAFYGCSGLTSVTIPNSVTSIGNSAFQYCYSLTCITIPNSVTSIGKSAFLDCRGLTSVTIPNSVTSIGKSAFLDCSGLTSIVVGGGNTVYDSRDNCNAIIETASNKLITGCQNTIIPNGVTSIGEDAFEGCRDLTSITIPNSVKSIGNSAFSICSGLTSITIPNSVTSIGSSAFSYCSGLQYIVFRPFIPPAGCGEAFNGCDDIKAVYIPCGTKEKYRTAGWKDELLVDPIGSVSVVTEDSVKGTAQVDKQASCDNEAIISATPNYGYHFMQWSDGNTDNPRSLLPTSDTVYMAIFAPNQYTITTLAQENGTVSGTGMYDYGTETTLTATPAEHYHFTQWNDGNTDNPRTVLVERDSTFTAGFAINTYLITVTYDMKKGYVSGDGTYDYGTRVKLVAEPNSGYVFSQWSDGTTYNPYIFTATEDITLEASFIPSTAVENTSAEDTKGVRKILHNGQIYILRNGKMYTLTGEEL